MTIPLVLTPEPCEECEGEVPWLEGAWEEACALSFLLGRAARWCKQKDQPA